MTRWALADAEERHEWRPQSFVLRPLAERMDLQPEDYVALIFVHPADEDDYNVAGERVWVAVTERRLGPRYTGRLIGQAVTLAIKVGQVVEFGPEHVADIERKDYP